MKVTTTTEITLNTTGRDVKLTLNAVLGYSGLGSYEFWGQKCYDRGEPEIDEITFDETGFSADEIDEINIRIENNEFDDAIWEKVADVYAEEAAAEAEHYAELRKDGLDY
jgi:hypothetical protein